MCANVQTMELMNENDLSFQVCKTDDDFKSAEDDYRAVLEGLWRYITSKTDNTGRTVQIFIRDRGNRVVGGVIGHAFGGWLYLELLWVEVVLMVCSFHEQIGVLLRNKLVDAYLVSQLFSIILPWEKLKPIIEGMRKEYHEPRLYEWFEYLYDEMKKIERLQSTA